MQKSCVSVEYYLQMLKVTDYENRKLSKILIKVFLEWNSWEFLLFVDLKFSPSQRHVHWHFSVKNNLIVYIKSFFQKLFMVIPAKH